MKTYFILAVLLGLTACGTSTKPDPRIPAIQAQHQQIVAAQRESAAQEKNAELIRLGEAAGAHKRFADLLQQSKANLASIEQLDPAKSQDPEQIALVSTAAMKEAELVKAAKAMVTYNQYLITTAEKRSRLMDSLGQIINAAKH